MTVRDWIAGRTPPAPPDLLRQIEEYLGDDADAPEERLPEVCIAAASRALERLVAGGRYGRDAALELLAVDALTTYAFENVSERARSTAELQALATMAAGLLGRAAPGA